MIHPYWDMALLNVRGLPDQESGFEALAGRPRGSRRPRRRVRRYPAFDPRKRPGPGQGLRRRVRREASAAGKIRGRASTPSVGKKVSMSTRGSSALGRNSGSAVIDPRPDTGDHCASQAFTSWRTTRCRCVTWRRTSAWSTAGWRSPRRRLRTATPGISGGTKPPRKRRALQPSAPQTVPVTGNGRGASPTLDPLNSCPLQHPLEDHHAPRRRRGHRGRRCGAIGDIATGAGRCHREDGGPLPQPELRRPKGFRQRLLTGFEVRCRAPPNPVDSPHSPTAATSSPTTASRS